MNVEGSRRVTRERSLVLCFVLDVLFQQVIYSPYRSHSMDRFLVQKVMSLARRGLRVSARYSALSGFKVYVRGINYGENSRLWDRSLGSNFWVLGDI